ncbi:MAG: hypothetical protein NC453_16980 [Muribaculum sp.]|nr:hypothetical protein [Muribaculum sp.]
MIIYIKERLSSSFQVITAENKPFSEGGQGKVYKILTPKFEEYCLKYYKGNLAEVNYERIKFMIENPPHNIMGNDGFRICWPTAFAYDENKKFIGYIMPLAFPKSRDLVILSTYNVKPISQQPRYKKCPEWFDKYELDTSYGMQNRIKMLCNWIIAIESIHQTGKYVIIDMKPENVMATASGKISIIDTDSFQISQNGKILFDGPVFTPEYFPPEGAAIEQSKRPFPVTVDYFAAAVCFYKILTGVHPYAGTIKKPPYDKLEQIGEAIQNNLFAFGEKKNYLSFNENFNLHKHFENLPYAIQQLFIRAFGKPENRPGMKEWAMAFRKIIGSIDGIKGNKVKPKKDERTTIEIIDVKLVNTSETGGLLGAVGDMLHADSKFIMPRVYYRLLKSGYNDVKLFYKLISPSGVSYEGPERKGYAASVTLDVSNNTPGNQIWDSYLPGCGSTDGQFYKEIGLWKLEFYENDKLLYRREFYINPIISKKPSSGYGNTNTSSYNANQSNSNIPASAPKKKKSKAGKCGCIIAFIVFVLPTLFSCLYYGWNMIFGDDGPKHDYVQVLPGIWNGTMGETDITLEIDSILNDSVVNAVISGQFKKVQTQKLKGYIGTNDSVYLDGAKKGKYFNGKFRIGMSDDGRETMHALFFDKSSGDTIRLDAHKDEIPRVRQVKSSSTAKKKSKRKSVNRPKVEEQKPAEAIQEVAGEPAPLKESDIVVGESPTTQQ